MSKEEQTQIIIDFVEGKISGADFEKNFKTNDELKKLLSDRSFEWKGTYIKTNPYDFIHTQNAETLRGALNIQGALKFFLDKKNINCTPTKKYSELRGLLLDCQPRWVDMDTEYFMNHIMPKQQNMKKSELKKYLKEKIRAKFKYAKKPPTWIQNADQWPIRNNEPLVFMGSIKIEQTEYFHDDGAIYIFLDPNTGNFETVLQLY